MKTTLPFLILLTLFISCGNDKGKGKGGSPSTVDSTSPITEEYETAVNQFDTEECETTLFKDQNGIAIVENDGVYCEFLGAHYASEYVEVTIDPLSDLSDAAHCPEGFRLASINLASAFVEFKEDKYKEIKAGKFKKINGIDYYSRIESVICY